MESLAQDIFELVKVKMAEQGAYDYESYSDIVDETVDYFYEKGQISDDDNTEFIKEQILALHETAVSEFDNLKKSFSLDDDEIEADSRF